MMKYIMYNDLFYIFSKKKKILFLIFIIPIFIFLININSKFSSFDEIIYFILGVNLNQDSSIFEVILFLINVICILYINMDNFFKDLDYNMDNIFLRVNIRRWYILKLFTTSIFISIIKCILYLLLTIIYLTFYKYNINIINIIFILAKDIIYNFIIFQLFCIILSFVSIIKKNKVYSIFIFSILLFILPHNINHINLFMIILCLGLFIVNYITITSSLKYIKEEL
jgi:hypothetical protein